MRRWRMRAWLAGVAVCAAAAWLAAGAAAQEKQAEKPAKDPAAALAKPQTGEDVLQAAKAAAPAAEHKQVDPSTIPPSITDFGPKDSGTVYPSASYVRRFAHSDLTTRLPRTQPVKMLKDPTSPLMLMHEMAVKQAEENRAAAAAAAAAAKDSEYNAPKAAPEAEEKNTKPTPVKSKPEAK